MNHKNGFAAACYPFKNCFWRMAEKQKGGSCMKKKLICCGLMLCILTGLLAFPSVAAEKVLIRMDSTTQKSYEIIEKDGFTVLKDFQKLNMGGHITKIVIISSLADTYEVQKSKSMGAFHYVAKPFELGSLMENIKDIYYYKEAPLADPSIFSKPVSVEKYVAEMLDELRIPSNVKGYKYIQLILRSEERRVGKECRSRWSPDH